MGKQEGSYYGNHFSSMHAWLTWAAVAAQRLSGDASATRLEVSYLQGDPNCQSPDRRGGKEIVSSTLAGCTVRCTSCPRLRAPGC